MRRESFPDTPLRRAVFDIVGGPRKARTICDLSDYGLREALKRGYLGRKAALALAAATLAEGSPVMAAELAGFEVVVRNAPAPLDGAHATHSRGSEEDVEQSLTCLPPASEPAAPAMRARLVGNRCA